MKQHTITFEPSEQDAQFIAGQLQEGSYKTQSELIRAGIRRLEEDDTKLKALRRLIEEAGREPIERDTLYHRVERDTQNAAQWHAGEAIVCQR